MYRWKKELGTMTIDTPQQWKAATVGKWIKSIIFPDRISAIQSLSYIDEHEYIFWDLQSVSECSDWFPFFLHFHIITLKKNNYFLVKYFAVDFVRVYL